MVFHEITREAIQRALEETREIDERLVDAQETRRILDRLYGYEVSPVLWKKVMQGLSAGRVQSVATRLVVERERERQAFVAAAYWDIDGTFDPGSFDARLVALDGGRVAQGRDFGQDGVLQRTTPFGSTRRRRAGSPPGSRAPPSPFASVEEKPYTRRPAPPFMTSTLQQEASRKLRFSSQTTMRVAQRLYENGLHHLHAHRLDDAVGVGADGRARAQATELYGAEYVPDAAAPLRAARSRTRRRHTRRSARRATRSGRPQQVARELITRRASRSTS